ncbi:MAG: Obg family GTPase CgtA [Candidatus Omnitrophica bacterium]|nr:Obg family GTPase CgtA [Candidatus Omnitrophota bacterium]
MFIDTAKITVKAGSGGKGVDSFYRDKLNRKGTPDGGDGGNGGSIIARVSTDVHTLLDFKYRQLLRAKNGKHGSSNQKRGRNGDDMIVKVPCGTLIYDFKDKRLLKDLVEAGDEFVFAKGGNGGKGNRSRKPATVGEEGEEKELFLELKLIADIGIIGFPNAGKSTLISRISKAHPKIAGFPFTTKNPVLGVVEDGNSTFKIVEIPGLIEGAHRGKGLGDKFLRHAERTKLYVHLLDLSREKPEEILSDYTKINKELRSYNKRLGKKKQIVVGNKIDIEGAGKNFEIVSGKLKKDIIAISAKDGTGIKELVKLLCASLE